MRNCISILSILFLSQAVNAEKINQLKNEQVSFSRLAKLSLQQNQSISTVRFSPADPKQGELVRAFIEVRTDFQSGRDVRSFVKFSVGENSKRISQQGNGLWVTEPFKFVGDGAYVYAADLLLEDVKVSEQTRNSLLQVQRDIQNLMLQIERETNPAKLADLQSQKTQKEILKTNYENLLNSLKRPVSSKTGSLKVSGDVNNEYPAISSCDPPFGATAGGNTVTLHGRHLGNISNLLIGGVSATILPGGNASSRQVVIPSNLQSGIHDIEATAEYQISGLKLRNKNSSNSKLLEQVEVKVGLKNGYYVVDGVVGSSYPVAFAGVPQSTNSGQAVSLDGSSSYSPDDATLTYNWTVVSKPVDAGVQDGVFSAVDVVNPTFLASAPGAYVISLVVSNGIKTSVPSLTVITVDSTDPVLIHPSQISGTALADGVYIGSFRACNNLQQSVNYQLFNNSKVVLISGFNRGTIAVGSCAQFQFSITLNGASPVAVEIPFVVQSPVLFRKMISVSVTPATSSSISLETNYPVGQWNGERDLEKLSLTSYVPLFGTYNEASSTEIVIKNNSSSPLTITNLPVITHLEGSSGVFSTDFPVGGLTIPANDEASFNLISSPGTFGSNNSAVALLEWEVKENEPAKVLMIKTFKLKAPTATTVTESLGSFATGSSLPLKFLEVPSAFFAGQDFEGLSEISSVLLSNNAGGQLSVDLTQFDFPVMVGDVDHVLNTGIQLKPTFLNTNIGNHAGQIQIKIKGYQQLFNYLTDVTLVSP